MPFLPGSFQADSILPGWPSWKFPGKIIRPANQEGSRSPASFLEVSRYVRDSKSAEIGADPRRDPTCRTANFQEVPRKCPENSILPANFQERSCFQVPENNRTTLFCRNGLRHPGNFLEGSRMFPGTFQEGSRKTRGNHGKGHFPAGHPNRKLPGRISGYPCQLSSRILPGRILTTVLSTWKFPA